MKIAIEVFSIVVVITIGCLIFASVISSNNQTSDARDFYNVVVNRIEDSNCSEEVIAECINEAKEHSYELTVEDVTIYEESPSRMVVMKYYIRLPVYEMFGKKYEKQAVIQGYAR